MTDQPKTQTEDDPLVGITDKGRFLTSLLNEIDGTILLALAEAYDAGERPICDCENLLSEFDQLGKIHSSSCLQHEWRLINQVIDARVALVKYGQHWTDCPTRLGGVCNCGLDPLLKGAS